MLKREHPTSVGMLQKDTSMAAANDAPPVVDSKSLSLHKRQHMEHSTPKSNLLAAPNILPAAESAPGKGHEV